MPVAATVSLVLTAIPRRVEQAEDWNDKSVVCIVMTLSLDRSRCDAGPINKRETNINYTSQKGTKMADPYKLEMDLK